MGAVSLFVTQGEWRMSSVRRAMPGGTTPDKGTRSLAPSVRPVTRDRAMANLYALAQQIARTSSSVLITGETGVGKDLMAQAIHRYSPRARRELVVLNCAAIPESLVESELFGYERGAFSGAVSAKPGLFEVAHGSTFFLDEIGELPLSVQAKLLRVLETGEVSRVGAVRQSRVDVRIVAATNRHLPSEIARGAFRADLYYRLNGLTISIPPLRARPDDIEILARHFAAGAGIEFSQAALAVLLAHSWPGNVRELKSVVERAALVTQNRPVEPSDLMLDVSPIASNTRDANPDATEVTARMHFVSDGLTTEAVREELERRELRRIKEALDVVAGNQTEAARLLGISRRTLMNRMDRLGIARPRKGAGRGGDG
jgi:transcriptional regulator with GAF, ATPase, and Fis domain